MTDKSAPPPGGVGVTWQIEHDGFKGREIGSYTTLEGKQGVVLQQIGTQVVHVYNRKWLKPCTAEVTGEPVASEALQLAAEYEAGTARAVATGYEEFGPDFQRKRKLIVDALRQYAHPTPLDRQAVERETIERCAKIADQVATNAERRGAGHVPQSAAAEAAYNKMDGAQDVAARIREHLPPLPGTEGDSER